MRRADLLDQLSAWIGPRRLVWFGTRGDDVESVAELGQLDAAFSFIAPYRRRSSVTSVALEELSGVRVDLDRYEIDEHPRDGDVDAFRLALLRTLARPSVVFTYRPSAFLSAVCFSRRDRCHYAGMFNGHQSAFEHKPWVESGVAALGIAAIPWVYVADADQMETTRLMVDGPVMLRRSRSSGGTGLVRVDDPELVSSSWFDEDEAFVSVAPYLDGIPVNVGAVAWREGVTLHPGSVQLIGSPWCTDRPFGYCGNDFGSLRQLGRANVERLEAAVLAIGNWLRGLGFVGAFGVDFLVTAEGPVFTEINPRLQGSTHASCQISVEADESCILLEHLAAAAGLPCPPSIGLWDQAGFAGDLAHLVVHHLGSTTAVVEVGELVRDLIADSLAERADLLIPSDVAADPGASIARFVFRRPLSENGFDLASPVADRVHAWQSLHGGQRRVPVDTLGPTV